MYSWDPKKSRENKRKHGISFEEARNSVFERPNLLVVGVAYDRGETRSAVIGKFHKKYYVAIFTIREGTIRIISVRRARHEEERQAKSQEL